MISARTLTPERASTTTLAELNATRSRRTRRLRCLLQLRAEVLQETAGLQLAMYSILDQLKVEQRALHATLRGGSSTQNLDVLTSTYSSAAHLLDVQSHLALHQCLLR